MKRVILLVLAAMLLLGACSGQTSAPETQAEITDWARVRDYLREKGDVVLETDMSTNADYMFQKIVIKGREEAIAVRYELTNRGSVNGAASFAQVIAQVDLMEGAPTAEVTIHWEASGTAGSKKEEMSYDAVYVWDIQAYQEGDVLSFVTDYTHVNEAGQSLKKSETSQLNAEVTGILGPVADALRKTLSESGLGITMADLGFVNY